MPRPNLAFIRVPTLPKHAQVEIVPQVVCPPDPGGASDSDEEEGATVGRLQPSWPALLRHWTFTQTVKQAACQIQVAHT